MILGSAVDCLVFSPAIWNERFAVAEQCGANTKEKKRCSKRGTSMIAGNAEHGPVWHCSTHVVFGVEYEKIETLSEDQSSTAFNMAKAVLNHDGAKVLLDSCEEFQLSLVWRENNLLCKGRLDGLSTELKTVIDLKKCQDASPEAFSRCIATYGYHRQGAMYLRGATYHGIDVKNYVIIAVEEPPPHAVALYTLTERSSSEWKNALVRHPSSVEFGNTELMRLLDLYERCEATGEWPGYAAEPVPISLPGWVIQRMERE